MRLTRKQKMSSGLPSCTGFFSREARAVVAIVLIPDGGVGFDWSGYELDPRTEGAGNDIHGVARA